MNNRPHNIHKLIRAAGSPQKLAIQMRMDPRKGADCIAHWKKRGIPRQLKIAYAALFDRIMRNADKGKQNGS